MRLIELARRPPTWLRIAFAGLVMAFVLNSIAHVTHRHDENVGNATHLVACGYCLAFNGLADAPANPALCLNASVCDEPVLIAGSTPRIFRAPSSSQPRAPPVS
jgi:hypothetical protein